ncbi:hypothetical protein C4565_00395 [Candidatus Parcubacteria bacterium]|nr:MAG: hypothetical protein C4565_00395 [Candidatus Parcubacteria bacterium]
MKKFLWCAIFCTVIGCAPPVKPPPPTVPTVTEFEQMKITNFGTIPNHGHTLMFVFEDTATNKKYLVVTKNHYYGGVAICPLSDKESK